MLFAIGSKVRLRHTGEVGVIVSILDESMLQVRLESDPDFLMPAFEEDLERYEGPKPLIFVPGKKSQQPEAPPRREIKSQYIVLKPKGLQLAFEPMPGRDGTVVRYKAWLINDTTHELLVDIDLFTAKRDVFLTEDKIGANTALELGDLLYDDLNESPEVEWSVRRITTAGPDEPILGSQKIRAKQFFNSFQTMPILNVPAYQMLLLDTFDPAAMPPKSAQGDLKSYTQQHARTRHSRTQGNSSPYRMFDVEEFAAFEPEIDLHIEVLQPGYQRLDKSEILRIQMLHFHRFIDKAVRLGVHNVFLIHGVGEGKLRNAIADALRQHPAVWKFKNEYHHKYGYGATEVIFVR
ncbi:MAG TPA: Smr/MutS family protein [Saprospiraceae bacterium]|nr:Smr/MutS family protein [Saprospiraceae bacterium]HND89841.1 Smr/MutS family protein [Saprospiraceae bacterium]